jgi:hypothetical protein
MLCKAAKAAPRLSRITRPAMQYGHDMTAFVFSRKSDGRNLTSAYFSGIAQNEEAE